MCLSLPVLSLQSVKFRSTNLKDLPYQQTCIKTLVMHKHLVLLSPHWHFPLHVEQLCHPLQCVGHLVVAGPRNRTTTMANRTTASKMLALFVFRQLECYKLPLSSTQLSVHRLPTWTDSSPLVLTEPGNSWLPLLLRCPPLVLPVCDLEWGSASASLKCSQPPASASWCTSKYHDYTWYRSDWCLSLSLLLHLSTTDRYTVHCTLYIW